MSQKTVLPTSRAAVFTAVCVCLAVAAHSWMSGAAIPPWAVLAGSVPVFATARLAAGRERSLGTILLLMGLDQTALHLLFENAQSHASGMSGALPVVSPISTAAMPGMQMPGMPGASGTPVMPMMQAAGSHLTGSQMAAMHMTPGMFAMHAVAALICAWWLRRGETSVHALAGVVAAWIAERIWLPRPGSSQPTMPGLANHRISGTGPIRPTTGLLRFVLARRGPPPLLSDQLRLVTP